MSLAAFSRILSPKSPVTKRQSPLDDTLLSPSGPHSPKAPSTASRLFHSKKKESPLSSRSSRTKEPRAYTFTFDPFNVFGSFRAKPKLAIAGSNIGSSSRTDQSRLSYLGYEDEDYGEPEAEAEEIRRPSGLGDRLSIGEDDNISDSNNGKVIDSESRQESQRLPQDTEKMSLISHETESEELAEIRYPSGLGDFKPTLNVIHDERAASTYPIFEGQYVKQTYERLTILEPSFWEGIATSYHLSGLPMVIPLLAPYLSRHALLSLTLVDNAVSAPSRRLLWKDITLKVNLSSAGVKGHTSMVPFDILSSRCGRLVRSMELQLLPVTPSPNALHRRRPPPLSICPEPVYPSETKADAVPSTLRLPNKSHRASISLETNLETCSSPTTHAASQSGEKNRLSSKLRRASFVPRPSHTKANLPEADQIPPVKLHSPSIQLSRPLSIIKRRSAVFLGKALVTQTQSPPQSPIIPTGEMDYAIPSPRVCLPGDSNWSPPPDWEWTPPARPHRFSSVPSPSFSFSTSPSPSPQTALNTPHNWSAPYSSEHRSRSKPSISSLRTGLPASESGSLKPGNDLRTSPSLPSLRALYSPVMQGPPSDSVAGDITISPVSPVTTPASPTTPYSTVSLSSFPLPPQISPPPSVPPLPLEFHPSYLLGPLPNSPSSPSFSLSTPTADNGLSQRLASASSNLVHLTHVTLSFIFPATSPTPVSPNPQYTDRKIGERNPDTSTIDTLRGFLLKLQSLRTLKIVCAPGQEPFHRAQWSALKDSLHDLKIEIVCVP